jgi:hypothetical protein
MAPDKKNPTLLEEYWTPCSPLDPEGFPLNWTQFEDKELFEPILTMVSYLINLN